MLLPRRLPTRWCFPNAAQSESLTSDSNYPMQTKLIASDMRITGISWLGRSTARLARY
jgi:hypothetical protein